MSAPIAQLDDEWESFSSFANVEDISCNNIFTSINTNVEIENHLNQNGTLNENSETLDKFPGQEINSYESMEDLVHTFDEKLAACFRINPSNSDTINETVDTDILTQDCLWKRLTDSYGLVQPLNWEKSQIRKLHIPALNLPIAKTESEKSKHEPKMQQNQDLKDEELKKQMDYHSMIEYNIYTEDETIFYNTTGQEENGGIVLQTADEVIEELEGIMQDAEDTNATVNLEIQEETGIIFDENSLEGELDDELSCASFHPRLSMGSPSSQDESDRAVELKSMSVAELNALNEDLEEQVKLLSSELLDELNLRDELQCEYEVKNTFISRVLEVQYKREQFNKSLNNAPVAKKFNLLRRSTTTDSLAKEGRFLTTVIPCNEGDKLTLDNLMALIKILDAIKTDSDEVPALLTSYILKVLCPAAHTNHTLQL
ncbi:fasciculation and elongation protein zeta-2-like [Clavelina lepadiformis]|uniref:fasciculation and elongation protein zeta-2-like n=1 Tax=Clavelina lepadiformis TaxID=159417 RepID=UPI004042C008